MYEERKSLGFYPFYSLFAISCQKHGVTLYQNQNNLHMIEEFVKWMATLPEWERDQKLEILLNLFAPSPAHEDFQRLKGALKRKEKMVKQLEAENARLIEKLKKLSKN